MECPISGCTRRLGSGMLMCRPHWQMVPKALQRAVWRQWRAYSEAGGTLEALRGAQQAAIAAVEKLQSAQAEAASSHHLESRNAGAERPVVT